MVKPPAGSLSNYNSAHHLLKLLPVYARICRFKKNHGDEICLPHLQKKSDASQPKQLNDVDCAIAAVTGRITLLSNLREFPGRLIESCALRLAPVRLGLT